MAVPQSRCTRLTAYFSVTLANEDPPSFRCLLLAAASHFSFHTGSLQHYKTTYHYQVSECYRLAKKKWLSQKRLNPRFLNFISFICGVEVLTNYLYYMRNLLLKSPLLTCVLLPQAYTNNISSADGHLDGLLMLIDRPDSYSSTLYDEEDTKDDKSFKVYTHQ